MLKQSPGRNQRPKGFKVKHVLQICVLLVICIWLLYQVKHSHDKKAAYEDSSMEILQKIQNGRDEAIKLGRRDLFPLVKDTSFGTEKHEGKEEETEGRRSEDGLGGRDEEIDVHGLERVEEEETEGVEDLIDEEDRERDEGSEEEEEKGIDFEDVNEEEEEEEEEEEGKSNIQEAGEGHYKKDDASGSVMQNMQTMSGSLRKVQEKEVESENKFEEGKEADTYDAQDFRAVKKDSETKVHPHSRAQSFGSEDAERVEEISHEFASSRSDNAIHSTLFTKANQSKVENNSAMLLDKGPTSLNGGESYLQRHSNSTLSTVDSFNAVQQGMEVLNGFQSISSQGTLQFDASDGTEKSTYENTVSSGESKTDSGLQLHRRETSSKMLTTDENLGAVDEGGEEDAGGGEETEKEESTDSSDSTFDQEDREDHSSLLDGL